MAQATIGALRVVLGLDSANFTKGLTAAQRKLRRVGKQMQSIGRTMSLAITAPIALIGGAILKSASDFEAGMARMRAVLKPTEGDFKRLRDLALELGRTTVFSATQAAAGMEVLAKNGLKATQILEGAAKAALDFAAASGGDLAQAADVVTDLLINFRLETSDLARVVDNATGALLTSKLTFEEYAGAVGQAAGASGGLGVSLEDMNAALSLTASAFASGTDAGTSFKGFLLRLVPQGDKAARIMKKLGLQFFDASGDIKSLAEIAEELKTALAGLNTEAKIAALGPLFGQRTIRTALRLAEEGAEGVRNLQAEIAKIDAAGVAADRLDNFAGKMRLLASALENLKITIAEAGLLKWATDLAKSLTVLVRNFAESSPAFLKWGTIAAGVAAVIGPLVFTLGLMTSGFANLAPAIAVVRTALLAMLGPWGLVAAAIALVIIKFDLLSDKIVDNTRVLLQWLGVLARPINVQLNNLTDELSAAITEASRLDDEFKELMDSQGFNVAFKEYNDLIQANAREVEELTKKIAALTTVRDDLIKDPILPEIKGGGAEGGGGGGRRLFSEEAEKQAERLRKVHDSILAGLTDEVFQLKLRAELVGKNVKEAAELFALQQALNDAEREGLEITEDRAKQFKALAVTIGEAAEELRIKLDQEHLFQGIADDITGPLKDAFKEGEINFQSFADTLVSIAARLRDRLIDELFKPIEDALVNLLRGDGKSGGGFIGILSSIGGAVIGALSGGGAAGFQPPVGASLSAGPFAHGGSFTVGGGPGVDSNVVAFRATRGEQVDITPANRTKQGGDIIIHQHNDIDARGAVEGTDAKIARAIGDNNKQLPKLIRNAQRRGM